MTFDGYIRVSRKGSRSGESFLSPDIQRDTIKRIAHAKGLELGEIIEEMDVSGSKRIEDRELGRLVERVERGESGGVIVWKLSRFSRSLFDAVEAANRIKAAGGRLIADDFDSTASNSKTMLGMLAGLAEDELDQRRTGFDEAQGRAVSRGIHIASRTPTGYRRRKDKRLEPNPKSAAAIAELFHRRAAGAGWTELAAFLDSTGAVGPYGNRRWTPSAVAKIVRNPVYLGEARSGRHRKAGAHEPLITRAAWEAAQARNGRPLASPRKGDGLLLAGLVRCAGCRYLVKADTMRDRDGGRLGLYRCRNRHAAGKCGSPASVLARVLDPFVEAAFLEALGPNGPLAEASASTADVDEALALVEEAERELVGYRDTPGIVTAVGGQASFLEGLQSRADTLEDSRRQLAEASERATLGSTVGLTEGGLIGAWPTLTTAEKRRLLSSAIDAVFLRPARGAGRVVPIEERALILWRGQAPDNLPRRGHRVPLAPFAWPDESPADVRVPVAKNA
jgi:DNA invertase Pin-like site-specific DNA recombinase